MSFWVASSNLAGTRITGSEELLSPGPASVDYPVTPAGRIVDTASGSRIKQTPPLDARPRAWIWADLPTYRPIFVRLIRRLESLLGSTRIARGLSPWIYIKDDVTEEFRIWRFSSGTATSGSPTTITDSVQTWTTNQLNNGTIELVSGTGAGQRRSVLSNTATAITVDTWGTNPDATTQYNVQYPDSTWIRVRVLNVSKNPIAKRAITFETVRLEFTVDDPNFNALG